MQPAKAYARGSSLPIPNSGVGSTAVAANASTAPALTPADLLGAQDVAARLAEWLELSLDHQDLLAGLGAGLWAKAVWLGRWERRNEQLLWVRPEWVTRRGPAGKDVGGYQTTGPVAGDARAGGVRRRAVAAGH